ncbi:MAG: hypothetical protein UT75_C0005G0076, partial [Candidatus Yanofskybacteria bacterium GW2011_GWE2_40_11]
SADKPRIGDWKSISPKQQVEGNTIIKEEGLPLSGRPSLNDSARVTYCFGLLMLFCID